MGTLFLAAQDNNEMTWSFNKPVIINTFTFYTGQNPVGDEKIHFTWSGGSYTADQFAPEFTEKQVTMTNQIELEAGQVITIRSDNPNYRGADTYHFIGLSNLTVTVVPEPETYALILAGLALAYTALRRRRLR